MASTQCLTLLLFVFATAVHANKKREEANQDLMEELRSISELPQADKVKDDNDITHKLALNYDDSHHDKLRHVSGEAVRLEKYSKLRAGVYKGEKDESVDDVSSSHQIDDEIMDEDDGSGGYESSEDHTEEENDSDEGEDDYQSTEQDLDQEDTWEDVEQSQEGESSGDGYGLDDEDQIDESDEIDDDEGYQSIDEDEETDDSFEADTDSQEAEGSQESGDDDSFDAEDGGSDESNGDDGYLSDDQESWEDDMKSLSEGDGAKYVRGHRTLSVTAAGSLPAQEQPNMYERTLQLTARPIEPPPHQRIRTSGHYDIPYQDVMDIVEALRKAKKMRALAENDMTMVARILARYPRVRRRFI